MSETDHFDRDAKAQTNETGVGSIARREREARDAFDDEVVTF